MKIAYLHGLESSIDQKDPKIKFLNKNFDKVYSPAINYKDENTFNKLYKDIKSLNPDLIVGSSIGGYVSYLIGSKLSIPVLLFNPAMVGRAFDPVVDDSNLKKTKTDIRFGKGDSVVSGIDVRKYFKDNKISFNHKGYDGGHRVPADVFINSIKDVLRMSEIHNTIKKAQCNMKHIKLFEGFVNESQVPKGMKKKHFKDAIVGDQVQLIDKNGKRFGSTTEDTNHDVFWITSRENRDLLKKIGEKAFIKQLQQFYNIEVKEVL